MNVEDVRVHIHIELQYIPGSGCVPGEGHMDVSDAPCWRIFRWVESTLNEPTTEPTLDVPALHLAMAACGIDRLVGNKVVEAYRVVRLADTLIVHDPDGDERVMPSNEVAALERAGRLLTCPNDEDDEAAGYHAHIHVRWSEYDAEVEH